MEATDVAVVGGGIAGASIAFHVAESTDREVTVYERGRLAGETTARSAAFFGFYGSDVERRMKRYGMARYNEFFADPRGEPYFDLVGRLRVATTDAVAAEFEGAATRDGGATEYVTADALAESVVCPELDPGGIEGALYRPGVGYLDPRECAFEFVARARENGAAFETDAAVTDVLVEDGRVTGLAVDGTAVEAGTVVSAAGPWNPAIADHAGVDLPVHHSLAPVMKLDPGRPVHTLPIVSHPGTGVYARGHRDGTVLVGHYPPDPDPGVIDPAGVGDEVPDDIRAEMWGTVEELLPALAGADPVEEWVGVRSHTPDGHPIAGPTGVEGFHVAAFDSSGIQLSPAVGRAVAAAVADDRSSPYGGALSIDRFEDA